MKKIVFITACIVLIFISEKGFSQSTPVPPTTPGTSTVSVSSHTSHSYTSNQKGERCSHTISVKNHNSIYRFKARFDDALTESIKKRLIKEFSEEKFLKSHDAYFWEIEKNNRNVFECKLHEGQVKMYVDKNMTSEEFQQKIEKLGEDLKHMISGEIPKEVKERKLLAAQKRLEHAKKAHDRAIKNLNSVKER
ncbi:hypothetical protein [Tenacibaculum sp. SDUM215027]|uniref:hypothetical protein n=1 Tax=Tenacibaculum sp. SDUM215027 TaxID=3422596 RepID=UPI003D32180C